jgi:hypothetical protein
VIREIGTFIVAVISHWQGYATGGVITGLIGVGERLSGKQLSKKAYAAIFLGVFLLVSFFLTWRGEYERANTLQKAFDQRPVPQAAPSVQVNVPPPTVIIQQTPSPTTDSGPTGFLQLEVFKFPEDSSPLAAGKRVILNFYYRNPGPYPVTDRHSFEAIFFAVRSDLPSDHGFESSEREIRASFEEGRKDHIKKNSAKKTEPVGAGQTMYKSVLFAPVSENAVKGIMDGTVRIYALAWATWKDSRKRIGTMDTTCYWLQPPKSTDLLSPQLVWHSCAAP